MSVIKPKRGSGSPAGSIATNEIAMDTTARKLYVSTTGSDAVILADDSQTYLDTVGLVDYAGDTPIAINLGTNQIGVGSGGTRLDLSPGAGGMRINAAPDMRTNKITNMGDPSSAQDAVTKNYVDTTSLLLAGGTMSGDIAMGGNSVTGLGSPSDSADAATKGFVDSNFLDLSGGTMTGDITMSNATSLNFDDNEYDIELLNASASQPTLSLKASAPAAGQRRTSLLFQQDDSGTVISQGIIDFRHRGSNGNDEFEIAHLNDDGSTKEQFFSYVKNSSTKVLNGHNNGNIELSQDKAELSYRLDINNGRTNSGGTLSPHALRAVTDMSQDLSEDLQNSITVALDYGAQSITNNVQNSITFQTGNDSNQYTTGRFNSEYASNGYEQKMKLISQNNAGSDGNAAGDATANGQIDVTSVRFFSNVPVKLPSYTVAQANAMPNAEEGMLIYITDGNAGAKTLAVYDGSNWKVVALGATIST